MRLSSRSRIEPSATMELTARAQSLRSQGKDIISFSAGEPDFPTPGHIIEAAMEAMDAGQTKYTAASGTVELRQVISEKLRRDNGIDRPADEIIATCGAKHALYEAFQVILDPGDEVVIPVPYWVSYLEQVRLAGGRPVVAQDISDAITPKTKAIVINSPSNPSGYVYSRSELQEIADIAMDKDLLAVSDEVYEKIIYDKKHYSIASFDGMEDITITINAVSKAYSMTGWRLGYAAGPKDIIKAMSAVQGHLTSNPSSISQAAALAALSGPQDCVKKMVSEFRKRRDRMVKRLNSMEGVICQTPNGAFYAFPRIRNSAGFCRDLLQQGVAAVPGEAFGSQDHVRFSYACSMDDIDKGMDRVQRYIESNK